MCMYVRLFTVFGLWNVGGGCSNYLLAKFLEHLTARLESRCISYATIIIWIEVKTTKPIIGELTS